MELSTSIEQIVYSVLGTVANGVPSADRVLLHAPPRCPTLNMSLGHFNPENP